MYLIWSTAGDRHRSSGEVGRGEHRRVHATGGPNEGQRVCGQLAVWSLFSSRRQNQPWKSSGGTGAEWSRFSLSFGKDESTILVLG